MRVLIAIVCFPSQPKLEKQGNRWSKAVEISPLAVSHDCTDMCISEEQLECSEEAVANNN
jgi:hypothetical protein